MLKHAYYGRRAKRGQTVVELLLVLPVFMLIVFLIMEVGMLAYQIILVNHATYEVARICALEAGPKDSGGSVNCDMTGRAQGLFTRILGNSKDGILITGVGTGCTGNFADPQNGATYQDIEVRANFRLKLFFPMTSIVLGGDGEQRKTVSASLRMPIEHPVWLHK